MEQFTENEPEFNAFLILALVKLGAKEAAPLMEQAFAAERVELIVMGDWEDVQVRLGLKTPEEVEQIRSERLAEAVMPLPSTTQEMTSPHRAARLLIADGSPPEIAAVHLLASDPAGDAETVATLRAAAQSAVTESAPELAIRALRRALREPPTPTERAGLLKELAMAEALVGDPEAFGHFEEAFAQTTGLNQMADGAVRYAMLLAARGGAAEAERMIDRVLGAIGDREAGLMLEDELYALAISSHGAGARQRLNRITAGLNGALLPFPWVK